MTWAQAFNNVGIAFAICVGSPGALLIWGWILAKSEGSAAEKKDDHK